MLAAQQIPKVSKEGPKLRLDLAACELKVSDLHLLTPEFIQCCDHKNIQSSMLSRKRTTGEKLQENQEDFFTSHQMGVKKASK